MYCSYPEGNKIPIPVCRIAPNSLRPENIRSNLQSETIKVIPVYCSLKKLLAKTIYTKCKYKNTENRPHAPANLNHTLQATSKDLYLRKRSYIVCKFCASIYDIVS